MAVFHDQLHRVINLPGIPKRIVSVVPSQTELLFYLGLDAEVIGITKFCIHPEHKFKTVANVGGTKQLNIDQIKALKPDLIIANKEENERGQVEQLMDICPVWISDINNLNTALDMITTVGSITGRVVEARSLVAHISNNFIKIILPALKLRVAYFIWRKPYMVAGRDTFINDMLQKCGLINVFDADRYPEISMYDLTLAKSDVIFLSSEPYPFKQKHIDEFKEIQPQAKIILVDGEMFSWYGSRLLYAPAYFRTLVSTLTKN
ncbi:ABC transporter substrate-binding protein [Mucilaginibacter sp. SP1R1]|uniref:ABC transporter substrate-binding protein n=1 Tax=Mucilaginibacter sp. SP1R1 TaxID=2723091 RepID=UPI00161FFDCF|nr:helical backbone metal receptor [Mucilaginibacter sp. SP1R1]MBB6148878.1 ABC-type Fe3+-hydroxamate transport system substrate-binding protein [Mucilaginibacter sp. SP1R1]